MRDLVESPEYAALMDRLWRDGHTELVSAIEDRVDLIAQGDPRARQHSYRNTHLLPSHAWGTTVRHRGDEWLVVWGELEDGRGILHALAPRA